MLHVRKKIFNNVLRNYREIFYFSLLNKKHVSYDTLAGIPWMSHSRITKITERVCEEGPYDNITWSKLSERIYKICDSFHMKEIGRILYAYSKVRYRDIRIIYKLIEQIKNKEIYNIDLLSCAHVCHALNNLNYLDKNLFELFVKNIKNIKILHINSVHNSIVTKNNSCPNYSFPIVLILSAYSKHCNDAHIRKLCLELLIHFLEHFNKYKKECTPQGLVMLLNSFSQIMKPSPEFFREEQEELKKISIDEYKKDDLYINDDTNTINMPFYKNKLIHINYKNESVGSEDCLKMENAKRNLEESTFDVDKYVNDPTYEIENNKNNNNNNNTTTTNNNNNNTNSYNNNNNNNNNNGYNHYSNNNHFDNNILNMCVKNPNYNRIHDDNISSDIHNYIDMLTRIEKKDVLNKQFLMLLLEITKTIDKMNTQSLSLIMNSCCRICYDKPIEFLNIISEEINKKLHLTTIRHLSLIINGYIKLNIHNPIHIDNIFKEIEKKIYSCDEKPLCFILSSMVKYKIKNENIISNINAKFILNIRKMNITTLCNILYYYTKLNIFNEDIINLYQIYLNKLIDTANIHHLALSAYVFSKNKIKNELVYIILKKALDILQKEQIIYIINNEYIIKDILMIINSMSALDIYSEILGIYLYYIINDNKTININKNININIIEQTNKMYDTLKDHKPYSEQKKVEETKDINKSILFLNDDIKNKIRNKNIYLSIKSLILYKDRIQKCQTCDQ
ncbi:conserved Plasmodium protein, unknown function [Plasmodium sp. DRC-Itaito]|nr:conserved Plasmodium protein, unknown function [Plasmodium sp. DRC-Itaito]